MNVSKRSILLSLSLAFFCHLAGAKQTLFDGYYRLTLNNKPLGYMVLVYEYDDKKKTFHATSFLKTNQLGGNIQESTKAASNNKFEPISYSYTALTGSSPKTIDASFKGEVMKIIKTDGKIKKEETYKIPKGTFLSSFLGYLMLQKGISLDKKFAYKAIAEEDGETYDGEAWIKEKMDHLGQSAFRILNKYKGNQFVSFMNDKGEVLGTKIPDQNIESQLMNSPAEATKDFLVPNQTLKLLFGKVPLGKKNSLQKIENKKNEKETSH